MFGVNDKKFSDQEAADGLWKRLQVLKEKCHEAAVEYVRSHPRKLYYALYYKVDPGQQKVYAPFDDDELKLLKEAYRKLEDSAKEYPFKDIEEKVDAMRDYFENLDVHYYCYIPDGDMHWAGGDPIIDGVDLEDWQQYCPVSVVFMNNDSNAPVTEECLLPLDDEQWTRLLELCIFDPKLTFHDLKHVMPEVFDLGMSCYESNHEDIMLRIPAITEIAVKLGKEIPECQKMSKVMDNLFASFMIQEMLRNSERYKSEDLDLWNRFEVMLYAKQVGAVDLDDIQWTK